jgi:hypothetical protein
MKHLLFSTITLVFFLSTPAFGEIYKWLDDRGVTHFTDDLRKVPEKYRTGAEDFDKIEHKGSVTYDPSLGKPSAAAAQGEPFYKKFLRQLEEEKVERSKKSSHGKVILYMTDW